MNREMAEAVLGEVQEARGGFLETRIYLRGHWSGIQDGFARHINGLTGPETEVVTARVIARRVVRVVPNTVDQNTGTYRMPLMDPSLLPSSE